MIIVVGWDAVLARGFIVVWEVGEEVSEVVNSFENMSTTKPLRYGRGYGLGGVVGCLCIGWSRKTCDIDCLDMLVFRESGESMSSPSP